MLRKNQLLHRKQGDILKPRLYALSSENGFKIDSFSVDDTQTFDIPTCNEKSKAVPDVTETILREVDAENVRN